MLQRLAWIATSAALAGSLSAGACTVENEAHCANREGDQTCADLYGSGVVCSRCEAAHNGCVDEPPTEACAFTPADTTAASTTNGSGDETTSSEGTSTTGGTSTNSTTVTSMATTMGSSSGGPVGPFCGDGVIDRQEQCDPAGRGPEDDELDGKDCTSLNFGGGELRCSEQCVFDVSDCTKGSCGNNEVDEGEECDGEMLDGNTCESVEPSYPQGDLACVACEFDTSDCCKATGALCGADKECCSNDCAGLLPSVLGNCG